MKESEYHIIEVESYKPKNTSGLHGEIHIRPLSGQEPFNSNMHVSCSKELSDKSIYPVGTRFKIKAKINFPIGEAPYVYSHYCWKPISTDK